MPEKLDKETIKALLEEADMRWHSLGKATDYRGHLDFTADYLVRNYARRLGRIQRRK